MDHTPRTHRPGPPDPARSGKGPAAAAGQAPAPLLPGCREVLARAPVLVTELDAQGRIRYLNPFLERLTGWSLQEVEGRDWFETFLPEEDRGRIRDLFREAMAATPSRSNVNAILTRRGERREIAWNDQVIADEEGRNCLLAIGMDITETLQLREKTRLAEAAIDSSPNPIAFADPAGKLSYVNEAFVRTWKLASREEALGRPAASFWQDRAAAEKVVQALHREGSWTGVLAARLADGSSLELHLSAHAVRDSQGRISALMAWFQDVSQTREAQRALHRSQELLRRILDSIRTFVVVFSAEGGILEANQSALNLVGMQRQEVVGRTLAEVPWWKDRPETDRVRSCLLQAAAGAPVRAEFTLTAADGRRVVLDMAFRPIREDGHLRIVVCGMDVTERTESLRVLEASEEKYRQLHQSIRDAFLSTDLQGRILECNPAFESLAGYSRQELQQLPAGALSVETWPLDEPETRHRILTEGDSGLREMRLRRKDGAVRTVELRTFLIRDRRQQPAAVWSLIRDISERRAMEEALRASEARLREAQQLAGFGNWELDLRTGELNWSEETCRIFEITPQEFTGSEAAFYSRVHPEDREMVQQAYLRSLQERTPYTIIHRVLLPDGRIKYVQEHCVTFYDHDGRPVRSLGTVQDITASHIAHLKLEASLREKEVLLRELHHRVKNNLQILSSLLHFQSQKTGASEVLRETQDRLRSLQLVHERLYRSSDLARVELGAYVEDLCRQLQLSLHDRCPGGRLEVRAASVEVPSQTAVPVGMLLTELVTNAFKHGLKDATYGVVRVETRVEGDVLRLRVEDSGPGLTGPAVPPAGGSFGLRLVQELVEQLHGTLEVSTGPGWPVCIAIPLRTGSPGEPLPPRAHG